MIRHEMTHHGPLISLPPSFFVEFQNQHLMASPPKNRNGMVDPSWITAMQRTKETEAQGGKTW
jgi:D-tyrosyl-tRNA(Tyr) deacylase